MRTAARHPFVFIAAVILGSIACAWLARFEDPARAKAAPRPADKYEETLYPSHHCDDGNWWTESADADTITVACSISSSDPHGDEPAVQMNK